MAKILVPLAPGCEELEAVTIIDLLRRARFEVISAGLEPESVPITASRGTKLLPDCSLNDVLKLNFDMLVLPGGLPGADHLRDDPRIIKLIQTMAASGKYICAICAAPRALAHAGILSGKRATSYPGTLDKMDIPGMHYTADPVTIDGKIITGRGPGAAMDFSLTLIETLADASLRQEVEQALLRP